MKRYHSSCMGIFILHFISAITTGASMDNVLSHFPYCYITVFDFRADINKINIEIPLAHFNLQHPGNFQRIYASMSILRSKWIHRRQSCQVIYIANSKKKRISEIQKMIFWTEKCDKTKVSVTCYGKHTYFLATPALPKQMHKAWYGGFPKVPFYQLVFNSETTVEIFVIITMPCYGDFKIQVNQSHLAAPMTFFNQMLLAFAESHCRLSWWRGIFTGPVENAEHSELKSFPDDIIRMGVSIYNQSVSSLPKLGIVSNMSVHDDLYYPITLNPDQNLDAFGDNAFYNDYGAYHFVTGFTSYNLLTCDGSYRLISLSAFADPFRTEVWLAILLFLISGSLFLACSQRKGNEAFKEGSFEAFLKICLEQSLTFVNDSLSMRQKVFRGILGVTFLMSAVVTSSYKGMLASNLATPSPKRQIQKVEEALDLGYKILTRLDLQRRVELVEDGRNITTAKGRELTMEDFSVEHNFIGSVWNLERRRDTRLMTRFRKLFDSVDLQISVEYSLEGDLGRCNKSMYVGTNAELNLFRIKNMNNLKSLYLGTDKFLPHLRAFTIRMMEWDRENIIYDRFQSIIQSGVFHHSKSKNELAIHAEIEDDPAQALNIGSNITCSAFLLFVGLATISILVFFCEYLVNIFKFRDKVISKAKAICWNSKWLSPKIWTKPNIIILGLTLPEFMFLRVIYGNLTSFFTSWSSKILF